MTTAIVLVGCSEIESEDIEQEPSEIKIENPTNKVGLSSDIKWEQMNPARGDKSPMAGTIWGDRKDTISTGYIGKFVDGFSSPPHIHNVTYRAIVMKGLIHNDDSSAENMWMPVGSFWTQPVGQPHITSAKGEESMAYIEIDSGPYLVNPVEEAFDNGERPVNIDASNIVWLNNQQTNWVSQKSNAEVNFLWENAVGERGVFVKLPLGFNGKIHSAGEIFYAVVIKGNVEYQMPQDNAMYNLDSGSYFESKGNSLHEISTQDESLIYIRTNDKFEIL